MSILLVLGRLNVNPPLCDLPGSVDRDGDRLLLRLLHHGGPAGLGLYVGLVGRTVVVLLQPRLVLSLLALVLVRVLALLTLRQVSPHLTNDPAYLPKLQLWILILDRVPDLPAVPHVGHQRLLWRLRRLGSPVLW